MKTPQSKIIIRYLQEVNDWVPAYKLRSVQTPYGWLGHQADRICRRLAETGQIQRMIIGRYANYRAKPLNLTTYKVLDNDGKVYKQIQLIK